MKDKIKKYLAKLPKRKSSNFEGFCPNCNFPVKGNFCTHCGQSTKSFQRPFWTVVNESVGDALSIDNRLVHTLVPLFVKPGFLTSEFMKGRRARYTPPFRLYLFLTFFAFMLLSYNHTPDIPSESKMEVDAEGNKKMDILSFMDEILKEDKPEKIAETKDSVQMDSLKLMVLGDEILNLNVDREKIKNKELLTLKDAGKSVDAGIGNKDIKRLFEMWKMNPSLMMDSTFKKLSQTLLILLPIFALLLALLYIRRKYYMLEHLLISLNFHSYIFVVVIISELLLMLHVEMISKFAFYLYFLIPIQLFLILKFYYKQSWIKTFFKFVIVSFIYNILLFAGVIISLVSMLA